MYGPGTNCILTVCMDLVLTALHCVVLTVPESEQLLVKWLQLDSGREYTEEELTVILQSATSESLLVHRSVRTHCFRHTHRSVMTLSDTHRSGMTLSDTHRSGMTLSDTHRSGMTLSDTQVRDDTVRHTQVRDDTVRHTQVRDDTVRHTGL